MAAARAAYVAGFAGHEQPRGRPPVRRADDRHRRRTRSRCCTTTSGAAFEAQVATLGAGTTLLVDTYDVEAGRADRRRGGPAPASAVSSARLRRPARAGLCGARAARPAGRPLHPHHGDERPRRVLRSPALLAAAPVDSYGVGTSLVTGFGRADGGPRLQARGPRWARRGRTVGVAKRSHDKVEASAAASGRCAGAGPTAWPRRRSSGSATSHSTTAMTGPCWCPWSRPARWWGTESLEAARARHAASLAELPGDGAPALPRASPRSRPCYEGSPGRRAVLGFDA